MCTERTPLRAPWLALGALLALACGNSGVELPEPPDLAAVRSSLAADALPALEAATKSVRAKPSDAAAWTALGNLYETEDVPSHAEVAYDAAARLSPDDPKPRYRAAIQAARAGETERALEHLAPVLELAPDYGPAWRRQGTWQLSLGDTEGARASFERVEELMPDAADGPIGLAQTALQDDRVDDALAAAQRGVERSSDAAYARLVLGDALRRAGRADEARPHLEAGQGALPTWSDPWSVANIAARRADENLAERGAKLIAERRWQEAVSVWREVLDRRPNDSQAMRQLGTSLLGAGEHSAALQHYERARARFPKNFDLAVGQVSAFRASGAIGEALASAHEVVATWPDRSQGHVVLGDLLGRTNDVEGARASFARALEADPMDFRARMYDGRLLLKLRRANEAATVMKAGLVDQRVKPPLEYFQILLQAQYLARRSPQEFQETIDRARAIHGDAIDQFIDKDAGR